MPDVDINELFDRYVADTHHLIEKYQHEVGLSDEREMLIQIASTPNILDKISLADRVDQALRRNLPTIGYMDYKALKECIPVPIYLLPSTSGFYQSIFALCLGGSLSIENLLRDVQITDMNYLRKTINLPQLSPQLDRQDLLNDFVCEYLFFDLEEFKERNKKYRNDEAYSAILELYTKKAYVELSAVKRIAAINMGKGAYAEHKDRKELFDYCIELEHRYNVLRHEFLHTYTKMRMRVCKDIELTMGSALMDDKELDRLIVVLEKAKEIKESSNAYEYIRNCNSLLIQCGSNPLIPVIPNIVEWVGQE